MILNVLNANIYQCDGWLKGDIMLTNSTDKNEKIVLGLMSYTFSETAPSIDEIKQIINDYRTNEKKKIYLYKDIETDNYIGLMAIEMIYLENQLVPTTINVERMAIIPSFKDEDYGYKMFAELKEKYPESTIIGTMDNVNEITEWTQKYNKE